MDPGRARDAFRREHGREPRLFRAPGRVNLIGEHTDYNDGFVLPAAIDRDVVVAAAPRADRWLHLQSIDRPGRFQVDLDAPSPPRGGVFVDYVEGVARALVDRGARLVGADLVVTSDVPQGAGLSSSAALEVAVGLALLTLAGEPVDRVALALAAQAGEHAYAGTRSGIMDPLISALGRAGHAMLIDCRSLALTPVPLPARDLAIVLCDTGAPHALATSGYNTRRAECELGVSLLREALPLIRALRDVALADLDREQGRLPPVIARRCRHVVTENARTLAAADALRDGRLDDVGLAMFASHRSLRDDFEVSIPELDLLVATAARVPGVIGARMTGGGFGGSTVNLVKPGALPLFKATIEAAYLRQFGRAPSIFTVRPEAGAHEMG